MKTFLEYDTATGRVAGTFNGDAPPAAPNGRAFVEVTDRQDSAGAGFYRAQSDAFEPPPSPPKRLSRFKFIQLMTPTEYLSLKQLAAGGDTAMIYGLEMLSLVEYVETGHPLVLQMLAYVVSINLMTQARADEIRDAFYATAV